MSGHEEALLLPHVLITLYLFPSLKRGGVTDRGCEQGVCSTSPLKNLHERLVSSLPRWGEEDLSLTSLFCCDL